MFDIWHSVSELRQPCLMRPLSHHLIGVDGTVRPEVLRSVDALLLERLSATLPDHLATEAAPRSLSEAERWINVSAMQKAIRRGETATATACAVNGWGKDVDHVFRRLAVCGVEDVGVGNLLGVAMALAAAGNAKLRHSARGAATASYLAAELAGSPKSRLACDLLSLVEYDAVLLKRKVELAGADSDYLRTLALKKSASPAERMICLWLLAGTRRFRSAAMPDTPRKPRTDVMRVFAEMRMPLILYYIADRAGGRLSEAMFLSFALIWEWLRTDPCVSLIRHQVPSSPIIDGFPAYAYDTHTREGRAALRRLGRECVAIKCRVSRLPPQKREMALANGVFLIEGGL